MDNSSPAPQGAVAVVTAHARNLTASTSKRTHLSEAGSDREQEDGTKGREVDSRNDLDIHHPNSSYHRNPEGVLLAVVVAAVEARDSGRPGSRKTGCH